MPWPPSLGVEADRALADVLRSGPGPLPAHAAWASAGRAPAAELLEPLVDVLIAGRLGGMHAQAALAQLGTYSSHGRSPQLCAGARPDERRGTADVP